MGLVSMRTALPRLWHATLAYRFSRLIFRRVVARASGRPSLVERGMATFLKCGGSVLAPHVGRSDSIVSNSNSTASFWKLFNTIGPNATVGNVRFSAACGG